MASELVVRFMLAAAVEIRARTNALGVILSFPKVLGFTRENSVRKGGLMFHSNGEEKVPIS